MYKTLNTSILFNKDTQEQQRISAPLVLLAAIFQLLFIFYILLFAVREQEVTILSDQSVSCSVFSRPQLGYNLDAGDTNEYESY